MSSEELEILRDVQARIKGIEAAIGTLRPRPAVTGLPARATTALLPGKGHYNLRAPKLLPQAEQIAAWMNEGKTQKQIVQLLAERGVRVDRTTLCKFIRSRLMPNEKPDA